MQRKDRTFIPRSSPPKTTLKAETALYSPTPHHNAPIPLRGAGKPALSLKPSLRAVGDAPPLSSPVRPAQPTRPIVTPQTQRTNGSRIPGPLTVQGQRSAGLGFGFAFPTSISAPKVAPVQTSPPRTVRPSFHIPLIHSPASKTVPVVQPDHPNPGINSRDNGGPVESVKPTMPSQIPCAGKAPHDMVPESAPELVRIPTAASNVSSESQYTSQSAARSMECLSPQNLAMNSTDADKDADSEETSEMQNNGVDCEDEDMVLSPGFDVIQSLANTSREKSIDHSISSEHLLITPRPRPFSRNMSGLRLPVNVPLSPLAAAGAHSSSSPSTDAAKIHRRSLLDEATNQTSSDTLVNSSLHSQKSKTKTPPPYLHPQTPGSIISEIESLIGHPCMNRDAIDAAYCEAGAEPEKPTYAVFGVRLSVTTRYASCSSVLGGQTHVLPLVVFACVEELYRAGLRSSRLLRPPSHAPITPTETDTKSPGHAQSTTHRFPELVASFNSEPKYGDDVDLALASLDDVSALLLTYLDCLPGGIIPVWVRDVLGDAVGICEEGYRDGGSESAKERKRAIRVAQLVLRLLPAAYFSLLVYLLAFLSQIPLYEAWNGWNVRGVARAFARVVVGVGTAASNRDECKENGMDARHRGDDVDWVAEEEDAVEVLEWLLVNWDDLSDGLFLGVPREAPGSHGSEAGRQQGMEMDKDAAMRPPASLHMPTNNNATTIVSPNTVPVNPSVNALLSRITFLENKHSEWQWLQAQHEAELHHIFQSGEEKIRKLEETLREEQNARARAEDALVKERIANANSQTSTEDALQAERRMWAQEVQTLRDAWERLGNAWDSMVKERGNVGSTMGDIVGRFAMGASKGSVGEN